MFDLNSFAENEVQQASQSKAINVPAGLYPGVLMDFGKANQLVDKETNLQEDRAMVELVWNFMDNTGRIKQLLNREEPSIRQQLYIDLTPGGGLDFGTNRNIGLGKLREALGQNDAAKRWKFSMLKSQMAILNITIDTSKAGIPFVNVRGVAKFDGSIKNPLDAMTDEQFADFLAKNTPVAAPVAA